MKMKGRNLAVLIIVVLIVIIGVYLMLAHGAFGTGGAVSATPAWA